MSKNPNSITIRLHRESVERIDSLTGSLGGLNRSGVVALACAVLRVCVAANSDVHDLPEHFGEHDPNAVDAVASALVHRTEAKVAEIERAMKRRGV